MKTKNLLGKKFGKLKVIAMTDSRTKSRNAIWKCLCKCGNEILVNGGSLQNGNTKSCGCLRKEAAGKMGKESRVHGHAGKNGKQAWSPEYSTWVGMKARCLNKNHLHYSDYGGRGIVIYEKWLDFQNFLKDMGPRPKNKTLDRIEVNGNYEPGNCRWANPNVQIKNRRMYIE